MYSLLLALALLLEAPCPLHGKGEDIVGAIRNNGTTRAQVCDNLFDFYVIGKMGQGLSEATTSDAIAFARQMLPTIPALLSSLVADQVAVVQAIDRPQAQIYYMNVKASTARGSITVAQQLIGATTGHATNEASRLYASDQVTDETFATGDGSTKDYVAVILAHHPVITGSVVVYSTAVGGATVETLTDNGAGVLVSDLSGGGNGTVNNYTTGSVTVHFKSNVANTAKVYATYRANVELDTTAIGGLDFEVTSSNVDAMVFPLKLNYTVFSAINLQKIHGMVLADEGMKFCTQEIKFAIDQIVLKYALAAAQSSSGANSGTSIGAFSTIMDSGQEWLWRINEFKRYVSKASMAIFSKTLRAQGNVIVGGVNVCSLIEQLQDFKGAAGLGTTPPSGPHVFGTLGNRMVICNPFYDASQYVVLHRGSNYLYAGLVYAPYVPLYATDPVTLADLTTQRGFMSQAAVKTVNAGMFCWGTISGY